MIESKVKIELNGLRKFVDYINRRLQGEHVKDLVPLYKKWSARYRSFAQRRYRDQSKGGGEWPPLAAATKLARARRTLSRARRQAHVQAQGANPNFEKIRRMLKTAAAKFKKEKTRIALGGGVFSILRDTGTLFNTLNITAPGKGYIEVDVPGGVEVGYGGGAGHPAGNGRTIADIVRFHHFGGKHLPVRQIIVNPDEKTVAGMAKDGEVELDKLAKILGN